MKKHLRKALVLIVALLALWGNTQITAAAVDMDVSGLFSARDYEIGYDDSESVLIRLNVDTAACDGGAVEIDGGTVTITGEGVYILSGSLTGMVIVDAPKEDKVQLVLDGAEIRSETSAALYIRQADKVFLTLAPGSENILSNGGQFVDIDENAIDGAVFAKDDLTLNGEGSLTISSPAGHGIAAKDELTVTSGTYTIAAAGHGLSGKDCVCVSDGRFTITAGKDGVHAENNDDTALGFVYAGGGSFTITAEGDGISASGDLRIDGGSFSLVTGGGSANAPATQGFDDWGGRGMMMNMAQTAAAETEETVSTKGLKSGGDTLLNGGTFSIDAADDAIHANGSATINEGMYELAAGDDGVHADAETAITGGTLNITQCYEGIEGQTVDISGGYVMLTATDDGVNAAGGSDQSGFGAYGAAGGFSAGSGSLTISGGELYISVEGDGLDSNGSLEISGGEIYINGSATSENSPLDCDGAATITGGVFAATGTSMMAQNFGASSTQGAMLVTTGSQAAGSTVALADSAGNELISWQADKSFDCVIISCPDIAQGETYTLTAGTYSAGITMTDLIYGAGGGMGGMMGGRGGHGAW